MNEEAEARQKQMIEEKKRKNTRKNNISYIIYTGKRGSSNLKVPFWKKVLL